MDTRRQLIKEYRMIYKLLYEKSYIIEHKDVSENCVGREKYELTWSGRNAEANITFDLNLEITPIIDTLLREEQFSMLFYDKSILQVEYLIESNIIIKQRLQFIKKCNKVRTIKEIKDLEKEPTEVEGSDWFEEESGIPVFFRVDYDPINHVDLYHAKSHFVISNVNNCRIPMTGNLSLSKFIELILHQVYDEYSFNVTESIVHQEEITNNEKKVMHFNW
ncbi:MAG: hypothetical protein K0S61_582 [Anaerocolumna sp.]|jgi:hypothetical protein|nr:hypothetical protein [Anaerocolumna sp.]